MNERRPFSVNIKKRSKYNEAHYLKTAEEKTACEKEQAQSGGKCRWSIFGKSAGSLPEAKGVESGMTETEKRKEKKSANAAASERRPSSAAAGRGKKKAAAAGNGRGDDRPGSIPPWRPEEITDLLDRLRAAYPDAGCALHHDSVYQLLTAVTLSAQTTDAGVNGVTGELFARWPDAPAMAEADPADVAEVIRSIGLYQTKSKRLVEQARMLVRDYDGRVPEDDAALRRLPGVGRKTADVVMAVGFGHQRIPVDTHVFRVAGRLGLAAEKSAEKTEEALLALLPQDRLTEAHHSLIFHGRRCCTARGPRCDSCPVAALCRRAGL